MSAAGDIGSAVAGLAHRAAAEPEDPWIFSRHGWDWKWLSWGQAADQVARGAEVLTGSPELSSHRFHRGGLGSHRFHRGGLGRSQRIAFDEGHRPDSLVAGLAIQAAGFVAVPASERTVPADLPYAEVVEGEQGVLSAGRLGLFRLPVCRSRLDRWQPRPIDLGVVARGGFAVSAQAPPISPRQLAQDAARFGESLPPPAGRPLGRPILCATPAIDPRRLQVLLAWTVQAGATWALAPEGDDFLPAVLWTRPTIVVALGLEVEVLNLALAERKRRRFCRLRAIVVVGEVPREIEILEALGIELIRSRLCL